MVLEAKLSRPAYSPDIVDRPHLYAELARWRNVRAVVIHAPAGYGKSSLVSRWLDLAVLDAQTAWVSLEEPDANPAQFVEHVATALEKVRPGVSALVYPILDDRQGTPAHAWRHLLSAFAVQEGNGHADHHVLLVLDDLHRAQSSAVDELLQTLLEFGPPHLHLILVGRRRTGPGLARLFAHEQVKVLDKEALRFRDDEIAEFLRRHGFPTIQATDAAALTARSEGWITGLKLALLSLQHPGNLDDLCRALQGNRTWPAEFLTDEVLDRQTAAARRFLLQTAILDEFNADLCAAVTDVPDARTMLHTLVRADLFIIRLGDGDGWFRYHHLFQDLLRYRLETGAEVEEVQALHRRAAAWLGKAGHTAASVRHLLAADDPVAAAELVEANMQQAVILAPLDARRLFDLLPDALMRCRPRLMLHRCFLALIFDERHALSHVEAAAQSLRACGLTSEHVPDAFGELLAYYSAAYLTHGEWEHVAAYATQAMGYIAHMRPHVAGLLHFVQMHLLQKRGEFGAAYDHGQKALMLFIRADFAIGVIALRRELANGSMATGNAQDVALQFTALIADPLCKRRECRRDVLLAYLDAAEERYWANDLDQAQAYLGNAETIAGQLQDDEMLHLVHGVQMLYRSVDQPGEVNVEPAEAAPQPFASGATLNLALDTTTRYLTIHGYGQTAWEFIQFHGIHWADAANSTTKRSLIPSLRAYIARGKDLDKVDGILEKALDDSANYGLRFRQLQLLALAAWRHLQMSRFDAVNPHLIAAVRLAHETGYIRAILDVPALTTALTDLGLEPLAPLPAEASVALTDRELAVLSGLAQDKSYQQIADELMITLNTVRAHVSKIYRKLSAHRREQAIARARFYGVLPAT